ncbi:MAG: hypothetical protein GY714_04230 [Desulfobacterales bacterium]|nr:hypothetical protein [Desulfobacterales bacterium]
MKTEKYINYRDTMDNSLNIYKSKVEKLRDNLIAKMVSNNHETIREALKSLYEYLDSIPTENDQKSINQALHCYKTFSNNIDNKIRIVTDKLYRQIKKRFAEHVRIETKNPKQISFEEWSDKNKLSEIQFNNVLKNLSTLQITSGCSNCCRRCNEWSLPFPRKHFTYEAIKIFLNNLSKVNNRNFSLYSASDPLDWESFDKDISDINDLLNNMGFSSEFGILTKVPGGKSEVFKRLLKKNADIGISITSKNRSKIETLSKEIGMDLFHQHDLDELTIEAGLDEDFTTIKPSITDSYGIEVTTDGIFQILPTFTSALSPTGQARISVTTNTSLFIIQKTGRAALPVQYFKPLTLESVDGEKITLSYLLEPQIENILLDQSNENVDSPGMMNLKEYFKTFEFSAVKKRNELLPTVIEDFKIRYMDGSEEFNRYKKSYLKTCDIEKVRDLRVNAFIFFLIEIKKYLSENHDSKSIVAHLRRSDIERNEKISENLTKKNLIEVIKECDIQIFDLFQILLLKLVQEPKAPEIESFLRTRDVIYSPFEDQFIITAISINQ